MPTSDASAPFVPAVLKAPRVILRLGSAIAILIEHVPADPEVRTESAQAHLRQAAGRDDIVLGRRASGRPCLEPPHPELGVSLAFRNGALLAAFSPEVNVGTDIEPEAPALDIPRLSADHFSDAETRALASLAPAQAMDCFLRMWVAKEAALKTTGRGIYDGLDQPDLSRCIAGIAVDGTEVALPAFSRLPAVRLAVTRVLLPDHPPLYCALAAIEA